MLAVYWERLKFRWSDDHQVTFERPKSVLIPFVLACPSNECNFLLDTDASNYGAGAVLSQIQMGEERVRVITYFSKSFSKSERNYYVTRRELLAIILAVKHFHPHLYGHGKPSSSKRMEVVRRSDGSWGTKAQDELNKYISRNDGFFLVVSLRSSRELSLHPSGRISRTPLPVDRGT